MQLSANQSGSNPRRFESYTLRQLQFGPMVIVVNIRPMGTRLEGQKNSVRFGVGP